MSEVRIKDLVKRFPLKGSDQTFLAVDHVSLDIADGEFLVLLGPSGCGKTTTLRCVAGLETQTEGDIYIGKRLVNKLPAGERDIAFVFQFYALYPHMNVYSNIAFPLRAMKIDKQEIDRQVQRVASLLKIEHTLTRRPGSLPSGEQQRVALGRAIIRQPQLFLMDEPLTNLDASLRADMRTELKRLQADMKVTTLYVTHDQTEAMSMAHRIAVMNNGVLQQVGTPLEIYDNPTTLFVAGFIGTPPMNFVNCEYELGMLIGINGAFHLRTNGIWQHLSEKRPYIFGVRSEDITIHTNNDKQEGIAGEIATRELLGDEIIYTIEINDTLLRAKTAPTIRLNPGEQVKITFDQARIHLFDKESEKVVI